jgi:exo-beta-1,3-glucanase (GH17 family)
MTLRHRVVLLLVPILMLAGCDKDPDPYLREDPFTIREFRAESGDRWIGNAVSYGPHRDGQRPGESEPLEAEIREDLALMLPHWNLFRVYGASGSAETLLTLIRDDGLDMKVVLGVWVGPDDPEGNRDEVDNAIRLAAEYPDIVVALSVGNETQIGWSAHKSPFDMLLTSVRRARAGVSVPITVADDFNYWNKEDSRAIAAEIDFIMMHAHPLWNGLQLEDALPWLKRQVAEVKAMHPDRAVVLGETGWATAVHDQGEQAKLIKGVPGEAEQKVFYEAVRAWAAAEKFPVFFFEAFDENWKGGEHPNEVEKHWGLFRADRTAKAAVVQE